MAPCPCCLWLLFWSSGACLCAFGGGGVAIMSDVVVIVGSIIGATAVVVGVVD